MPRSPKISRDRSDPVTGELCIISLRRHMPGHMPGHMRVRLDGRLDIDPGFFGMSFVLHSPSDSGVLITDW